MTSNDPKRPKMIPNAGSGNTHLHTTKKNEWKVGSMHDANLVEIFHCILTYMYCIPDIHHTALFLSKWN